MGIIAAILVCAAGCAAIGVLSRRGGSRPDQLPRYVDSASELDRVEESVEGIDERLQALEERVDFSEQILLERSKKQDRQ